MGTNYYLRSKPCEKCGTCQTEKHIGKSSVGWQFHFRGYKDSMIVSFKDWIQEFTDPNKEIYDEYGNKLDIEKFINIVSVQKHECLNYYNICFNHPMNEQERKYIKERMNFFPIDANERKIWKDNEGYAFSDSEFS